MITQLHLFSLPLMVKSSITCGTEKKSKSTYQLYTSSVCVSDRNRESQSRISESLYAFLYYVRKQKEP